MNSFYLRNFDKKFKKKLSLKISYLTNQVFTNVFQYLSVNFSKDKEVCSNLKRVFSFF